MLGPALYRFALLYNLPVLNMFGYFSLVVWGLFKTLWLSAFVWLMLSVEVLLFFYDAEGLRSGWPCSEP